MITWIWKDEKKCTSHFPSFQHNNDTEKCIRTLEQESQRSLFGLPTDFNNHPGPPGPNNSLNHSPFNNSNWNNSQQPSATGGFGLSPASLGMSRYQEVPVKHETTHISTVKHTVGPPSVPPKPPPVKPEPSGFTIPTMPSVQQTRPILFIDPANRDDPHPHTAPVRPIDFTPFMDSSPRRQTDIPNIRCGPPSLGAGGASGGSPESRRPVRVINVQGYPSGGTVTSGPVMSPTSASSSPRFRVVLGDGGGVCSMPSNSAPVTPPKINPYQFSGQAYVPPQPRAQETERSGLHSSSIYIDSTTNPKRTNIQESGGEPSKISHSQSHLHGPTAQLMDAQGPSSVPAHRATQPLTVSLSSLATANQGPLDRGQNVVSFAEFAYTGGYSAGYGNPTPPSMNSGNFSNMDGGGRFSQEGASPSPPRSVPLTMALQGMNQLSLSPGSGAVGPPSGYAASSPMMGVGIGGPYSAMSPILLPKSPRLQHQRSTGSSTSRSNSMDSEQGSTPHPSDPTCDPFYRPSPPAHYPHRGMVGMGITGVGMPVLSPASSQSSLSSESSAHNRDLNSASRRRSGSLQEEAAYTQGQWIS